MQNFISDPVPYSITAWFSLPKIEKNVTLLLTKETSMISIPYQYVIYRESVLATVIALLGTACWVAAAVFLIELFFVYGIGLLILAVFFSIYWAPYIAACRVAKKAGVPFARRSLREFVRSTRKALLLFCGLFLVLAGDCLYTILSNDAIFSRQQEARPIEELFITDLTEGQYVKGELFSFINGIAYEGETEETATKYYALLLMADGVNTPVCYPVELPGAKWKKGDAIIDAFYSYWTNPDVEFYEGETIPFFGSLQSVSALDPDIQKYYQEALDNCGVADWRGELYFRSETPLSSSANDIYDIILYGSSAIALLLLILALWGFSQENLAKKTI